MSHKHNIAAYIYIKTSKKISHKYNISSIIYITYILICFTHSLIHLLEKFIAKPNKIVVILHLQVYPLFGCIWCLPVLVNFLEH